MYQSKPLMWLLSFSDDEQQTQPCWKIFDNNEQGFYEMKAWLQSNEVPFNEQLVICDREYRAVSPAAGKILQPTPITSMYREWGTGEMEFGIARGKSDKIDSRRLAVYAVRFADRLKPLIVCMRAFRPLRILSHFAIGTGAITSLQTHLMNSKLLLT